MPIYEYVCANGHRMERLQKVGDTGPEKCDLCSATVNKTFSNFSLKKNAGMWFHNRQTGKTIRPS